MSDTLRITTPGIYDLTAAQYHADPAADPSLSNSIAQLLLDRSPWHAWHAHPRLNPAHAEEGSRRLDLGSVAHALLLNRGRSIEVIDADDFRGKVARDARDAARAAGKIPVVVPDYERAQQMVKVAVREVSAVRELGAMFHSTVARSEVVALWREGECWARAMIDRTDMITVMDYKSCTNAAPAAVTRLIYGNGYHVQRAWYLRGLDAIDASGAGRRRFLFLFQEIDEPFACSVVELDGAGAALGERQCALALRTWRECMSSGVWPSYPRLVHRAEMPPWVESSILARELADDERRRERARQPVPADILAGA